MCLTKKQKAEFFSKGVLSVFGLASMDDLHINEHPSSTDQAMTSDFQLIGRDMHVALNNFSRRNPINGKGKSRSSYKSAR